MGDNNFVDGIRPDSFDRFTHRWITPATSLACSAAGLFMGMIDGNAWFLSIGVILGLYGAANVAEKSK